MPALHWRLALAVACELRGLSGSCTGIGRTEFTRLLEPQGFLHAEAVRRGWNGSQRSATELEDGLIDEVHGEAMVHSLALAIRRDGGPTASLHMAGRDRCIYPFLEEATASAVASASAATCACQCRQHMAQWTTSMT